jgi:quercetin dioxygenase-like cupin family protein
MDVHGKMLAHVISADEVETERFDWGQITWLDCAALTGSETLTVGMVYIYPGATNPPHTHPNCDESLVLLQGELRHTIGDEVFDLKAGDLIHIPQGKRHQAESVGWEPARMMVCYNTGRREVVGEF